MQCFDQLDKISKMERIQFLCNDCGKDFVVDVKLGLHMYAMQTEKLLNVLSVVRGAVGWQNSKTTCGSINHKTM